MASVLSLKVPSDFALRPAVNTYGYYRLAPNVWDDEAGVLIRPLHDADGGIVVTRTTQTRGSGKLTIRCDHTLNAADRAAVKRQVTRMLRLDENLSAWRRLHRPAAKVHFGRLFRSPTLFEDIIKTITSCNISWGGTIAMNQRMVEHFGEGGFPTARQLAAVKPAVLQKRCRVGYRADRMVKLARDVVEGRLDMAWFESPDRTTDELFDALRRIHGVGPYAASNILQHLGHYDRLPVDSELIRHLKDSRGLEGTLAEITRRAHVLYDPFAPYQFLAYWFELWTGYRQRGVL
ncbi:hypothetical protein HED60_15885 [Planctomycetales bacterium ZRK34]|nr:hypothetical protein HED60_15885 [Planctomycetales bacterium ZRK34]